jgi:hypothetical protein
LRPGLIFICREAGLLNPHSAKAEIIYDFRAIYPMPVRAGTSTPAMIAPIHKPIERTAINFAHAGIAGD